MKAKLDITGHDVQFELDDVTIDQFKQVYKRPSDIITGEFERYTVGKPITLITDNMPPPLKQEIIDTIKKYCNI